MGLNGIGRFEPVGTFPSESPFHKVVLMSYLIVLCYGIKSFEYPSRSTKLLERLTKTSSSQNGANFKANVPLRVLVVGAGLGGLATAVALARRGHEVTVLEQAPILGEVWRNRNHCLLNLC